MKLQRKWLINRNNAFNCPLCSFPEPQDYPFSASSQVKEKVTKQPLSPFSSSVYKKVFENKTKWRQVPPIYFEAEDMARKENSCFFCWDWQKTKKYSKALAKLRLRSRHRGGCVTLPEQGMDHLLSLSVSRHWANFSTTFQTSLRTLQLL